jgi:hypothetical protein
MGLSWLFHLIQVFYLVFSVYIGVQAIILAEDNNIITRAIYNNFQLSLQKMNLILAVSEAILYPMVFYFSYKFWKVLIGFYTQIFGVTIEDSVYEEVINPIYAANVFLVIPIGGKLISFLAQAYYLFKGLKEKCSFTSLQAFLVLLTPIFIAFILFVLVISYFIMLFSFL